ncbi:Coenzyme PQQ biosynthesis protein A [Methylophilaceae bacterium]
MMPDRAAIKPWRIISIIQTSKLMLKFVNNFKEMIMWTTPAATEMRFGFEVTMYVMNK